MIYGDMSPINSTSVLDSVLSGPSANSSVGQHEEERHEHHARDNTFDLDDDSDLHELMSRVERVGRDDKVEQTETELADYDEQPHCDGEEVDSNHDDKSRVMSEESDGTTDTSACDLTANSSHTFDSAATIKLESDAEMPVIRAEDVTTLADDDLFTEQSDTFTEELNSVHEHDKGEEFAWNLDASSDNLLGMNCTYLFRLKYFNTNHSY